MASEFDLIKQYFQKDTQHTDIAIGDDAAALCVDKGHQLVVSSDMLVAGKHFLKNTAANNIGWKSLAVNLSDMAAMGAKPKWATLSLALPNVDHHWLSEFSRGFFSCASAFDVDLIGGDTTQGPLNISVTMMGEVIKDKAIRRGSAKIGDDVWVSGILGNAALALAILKKEVALDITRHDFSKWALSLHRPQPRIALGQALINQAHAAIDISDGLIADLGHILQTSGVGAKLYLKNIPTCNYIADNIQQSAVQAYALAGGDDYELCFTAPPRRRNTIESLAKKCNLRLSRIGKTTRSAQLTIIGLDNKALSLTKKGFDHFA